MFIRYYLYVLFEMKFPKCPILQMDLNELEIAHVSNE